MANIYDINNFCSELLEAVRYEDIALNGIQVSNDGEIKKIGFAVDAVVDTINEAAHQHCQLLITHHGIFWGKPEAIDGSHGMRVKSLIRNNMGLISYHIPLDASDICGNNIEMCRLLGLTDLQPFGRFKGSYVGYAGQTQNAVTIDDVYRMLDFGRSQQHTYLGFGKNKIRRIAVVSGGAGHDIYSAVNHGCDLFITGECSHELYHYAKESGINGLFLGHYWTETFGVKSLSNEIKKQFPDIETVFIDMPTGL
ncbi:MAG: Nif3-like dinuclear metal center hexameric protein [Spirochaetales bacterium]|nr:Nif3-like dinuclear metal center hexameric protein [Spirochaetales bacterium]